MSAATSAAGWRDSNNDPVILTGPGVPGGLEGGTLIFGNGNDATFTGGGQIGYNYQIGSWVIGAEADIQGIDSGNNANAVFIPGPGFAGGDFVPGEFEERCGLVGLGAPARRCRLRPLPGLRHRWSGLHGGQHRLGGRRWCRVGPAGELVRLLGGHPRPRGSVGQHRSRRRQTSIAPSGPLLRLAERRSMCSCRGTMTSRTSSSPGPS